MAAAWGPADLQQLMLPGMELVPSPPLVWQGIVLVPVEGETEIHLAGCLLWCPPQGDLCVHLCACMCVRGLWARLCV